MRIEDLDRALGPTPQSFCDKMHQTLLHVEEEKQVKRIALRTVLIFALLAALLCSTSYAVIYRGFEWYYNSRFSDHLSLDPATYETVMSHLQTGLPQTASDPDIHIAVQEAVWLTEERLLVVFLTATPTDPDHYELHDKGCLDADGAYVGKDGMANPESFFKSHTEHWLWTTEGHGPVDQMIASGKELLLVDMHFPLLDGIKFQGTGTSMGIVRESDTMYYAMEIQLNFLDPAYDAEIQATIERDRDKHPESIPHLEQRLSTAPLLRQLFAEDADGLITLTIPYTVTLYSEDDAQLYTSGRQGEISFQIQIQ